MTKRSMFLVAALGLYVSSVFVSPSHAGSVYLTEVVFVNTSGKAANDFEATFTGTGGTISDITVYNPPAGNTTSVTGGNTVVIDFSPALGTGKVLDFSFETQFGSIAFSSGIWTYKVGAPIASAAPLYINTTLLSVPEPASMALLGIGMASFFAFRRFFNKQNANV